MASFVLPQEPTLSGGQLKVNSEKMCPRKDGVELPAARPAWRKNNAEPWAAESGRTLGHATAS